MPVGDDHGVGGVMEAVRERERESHGNGSDEGDVHRYAPVERDRSDSSDLDAVI